VRLSVKPKLRDAGDVITSKLTNRNNGAFKNASLTDSPVPADPFGRCSIAVNAWVGSIKTLKTLERKALWRTQFLVEVRQIA